MRVGLCVIVGVGVSVWGVDVDVWRPASTMQNSPSVVLRCLQGSDEVIRFIQPMIWFGPLWCDFNLSDAGSSYRFYHFIRERVRVDLSKVGWVFLVWQWCFICCIPAFCIGVFHYSRGFGVVYIGTAVMFFLSRKGPMSRREERFLGGILFCFGVCVPLFWSNLLCTHWFNVWI